jgi:hypothetical protein
VVLGALGLAAIALSGRTSRRGRARPAPSTTS